ncbi:MAG: EAL domain-containing protein [Solidesulfovibrio sp. DCME]|uniref:EAL domain-containing protein n=1 Tax=Solidesulfovibrio sp. DCME TaxID=3447380 RepID=UPI003D13B418
MAHTLFQWPYPTTLLARPENETGAEASRGVFFRALVELGTGQVAGIETALGKPAPGESLEAGAPVRPFGAFVPGWPERGSCPGRRGEPTARLVRADLATRPDRIGQAPGPAAARTILMFDVTALCREPARSLELLVACKRAGARILLDNFDLDEPPARFMEMLPADILRVSPSRMPWHWEPDRRRDALEGLLAFAGNLLMDVAVAGVSGRSQRLELKRLGVRYAQGDWRRDGLGHLSGSVSSGRG